jgi:hypothetical protein
MECWAKKELEPLRMGVAKVFRCIFVPFKAGSEILPVRSGAGKLEALPLSKLNARERRSQELSSRVGKGFSVPFCFLKLEVEFCQYVAARTSSGTTLSKLNARERRSQEHHRAGGVAKVFQCLFAF